MSYYFGCDALTHLALRLRVNGQSEIRMRLDVDEARRDRQPGYIDLSFGRTGCLADCCDSVVRDREVAAFSRPAAAIVEGATAQDEIKAHADFTSTVSLRLNAGGADDRLPTLALCINVGLGFRCRAAAGYVAEGG